MAYVQTGAVNGGGWTPARETAHFINRTGTTLSEGSLVAINGDFAAASGNAMVGLDPSVTTDDASGYLFNAAITPVTENMTRLMAVALKSIPDNAEGEFGIYGIFKVLVAGATNKGEFITGTTTAYTATPLTLTELQALTTATTNVLGFALETTAGAGSPRCFFDGKAFHGFFAGDT